MIFLVRGEWKFWFVFREGDSDDFVKVSWSLEHIEGHALDGRIAFISGRSLGLGINLRDLVVFYKDGLAVFGSSSNLNLIFHGILLVFVGIELITFK